MGKRNGTGNGHFDCIGLETKICSACCGLLEGYKKFRFSEAFSLRFRFMALVFGVGRSYRLAGDCPSQLGHARSKNVLAK